MWSYWTKKVHMYILSASNLKRKGQKQLFNSPTLDSFITVFLQGNQSMCLQHLKQVGIWQLGKYSNPKYISSGWNRSITCKECGWLTVTVSLVTVISRWRHQKWGKITSSPQVKVKPLIWDFIAQENIIWTERQPRV